MKHVHFSYYFIEKIHLKKYTDILLLWIADKDALKVNSLYIYIYIFPFFHLLSPLSHNDFNLSTAYWYHLYKRAGEVRREVGYYCNIFSKQIRQSIINISCSVHYCIKEPQHYAASLWRKLVRNGKKGYLRTITRIHCCLEQCIWVVVMCNWKAFIFSSLNIA